MLIQILKKLWAAAVSLFWDFWNKKFSITTILTESQSLKGLTILKLLQFIDHMISKLLFSKLEDLTRYLTEHFNISREIIYFTVLFDLMQNFY